MMPQRVRELYCQTSYIQYFFEYIQYLLNIQYRQIYIYTVFMKYTCTIQSIDQSMESSKWTRPTICDTWCTFVECSFCGTTQRNFLYSVQ